ncbi:Hypothetical predicted protein [Olea europaea subsp. europaea]|uniref:Uncharacterized protein n=1 Tax=Olea europaea subsp. europaea TaxID=158383 RepID=A0A8S0SIM9_OLEEU|nr:Hypothetical predicted protein [Olea europaea subsp. europaea]
MAYAALCSLAQILHQTLNRDYQYLILDEKQQIESLVEKITSLQKDFSLQKITREEETDIRDAAYIAEDIIESRIIERFRTESAGHEDGSTEKNLIRFDVVQNIFSLISASSRSGLEIVGVGGIEKPCTFQTIYGIRQLARTRQFKAWFLYYVMIEQTYRYLDAIWTIESLATSGAKIVIISDYPFPASAIMEDLCRKGFDTSLFVGAITTEDLRRDHLLRADDAGLEELGPSNIDITSEAELGVTKKTFFTGLKHRIFFPQISQAKKFFTLIFKWAWWKKPSPVPSPRPCVTWYDQDAINLEMYKSAMVMAGVDAADRCIAVGGHLDYIKAAYAAGISSIFLTADLYGRLEFADIRDLAAEYGAHPTYLLPSFTW